MRSSLFRAVPSIACLVAGCAGGTDGEKRFSLVSNGMSRERVSQLLGPPFRTEASFEPGSYNGLFLDGQLRWLSRPVPNQPNALHSLKPGELAAMGLKPNASLAEVDAAMGTPTTECSSYRNDAWSFFHVCFKDRRVISKDKGGYAIE
jgi:hypothetical protein